MDSDRQHLSLSPCHGSSFTPPTWVCRHCQELQCIVHFSIPSLILSRSSTMVNDPWMKRTAQNSGNDVVLSFCDKNSPEYQAPKALRSCVPRNWLLMCYYSATVPPKAPRTLAFSIRCLSHVGPWVISTSRFASPLEATQPRWLSPFVLQIWKWAAVPEGSGRGNKLPVQSHWWS